MPNEFTNNEYKQILDCNKIQYAKAERMRSRRDGRLVQMFQIELKYPPEAEAIISNNITCPQMGLFLRWKSFVLPFRSSSVITAKISETRPKIVRQELNVPSVEKATHTKDAQIEKKATKGC